MIETCQFTPDKGYEVWSSSEVLQEMLIHLDGHFGGFFLVCSTCCFNQNLPKQYTSIKVHFRYQNILQKRLQVEFRTGPPTQGLASWGMTTYLILIE